MGTILALPFFSSVYEKSAGRWWHDRWIKYALFTGACYDTVNNMLWTCSNDYIDQWCNPGNQAFHYVCQRLGVSHIIIEPKGEVHWVLQEKISHIITEPKGEVHWVLQERISYIITEPKGEVCWVLKERISHMKYERTATWVSGNMAQATKCVNSLPPFKLET